MGTGIQSEVPADFCRAVVCSFVLSHIHNLDNFAVSVETGHACLYCLI